MAEEDDQNGESNGGAGTGAADYEPARFERSNQGSEGSNEGTGLEAIMDIPVELSAEIGRTRMPISQLIKLTPGSVVELDRLAGEPLDVLANGRLVARGEVVVMNDRYGLRLTEVVSDGNSDEGS